MTAVKKIIMRIPGEPPGHVTDYTYCRYCDEQRGDHRARDLACPVSMEHRSIYSSDTFFEVRDDD